jgi:hypothetical protein
MLAAIVAVVLAPLLAVLAAILLRLAAVVAVVLAPLPAVVATVLLLVAAVLAVLLAVFLARLVLRVVAVLRGGRRRDAAGEQRGEGGGDEGAVAGRAVLGVLRRCASGSVRVASMTREIRLTRSDPAGDEAHLRGRGVAS